MSSKFTKSCPRRMQEQELLAILQTVAGHLKTYGPIEGELSKMDMIPVASSIIKKVGYDFNTSTLRLELDTARTYEYYNVPFTVYSRFMAANSKGAFYNLEIKGKYNVNEIKAVATSTAGDPGRLRMRTLLDRAMDETPVGKSFLPRFVELVLEDGSTIC